MRDAFGRDINYMRVSVTDRCNLRCKYCMPEDLPDIPHGEILRYEEILRVCAAAASLGIADFRVTGGEPLVRLGCIDFLRSLRALPGVEKIMVTTNGLLLEQHIEDFRSLGIDSVNVSLDTMDREAYRQLTGADAFDRVYAGIMAALDAGLRVKLNCVAMRGVNESAFLPLAGLAEKHPIDVRFIESMPIGAGGEYAPVPMGELVGMLKAAYPSLKESHEKRGSGPAVYMKQEGLMGHIGFIHAISHAFCDRCNRIRLTSDGLLKTCLYYDTAVDLKPALRGGADEEDLRQAIQGAVEQKQERHSFHQDMQGAERRKMSQIGG